MRLEEFAEDHRGGYREQEALELELFRQRRNESISTKTKSQSSCWEAQQSPACLWRRNHLGEGNKGYGTGGEGRKYWDAGSAAQEGQAVQWEATD